MNISGKRSRNFSFLVYPEGLTNNFTDVLNNSGGKGFYILHDMDRLEDGTLKKAHYHILIMFENPRSFNSIAKLATLCGCANGFIEPIKNSVSYARYLCHMDSPNKYPYELCEVSNFGGADYEKFCETTADQKRKKLNAVCEIVNYICDNRIYSYSELFEYCCKYRQDWLEMLLMPSIGRSILEYLKSKRWTDNK